MTSETSARETPAARATSSIVGGPARTSPLTAMTRPKILLASLERANNLERSNRKEERRISDGGLERQRRRAVGCAVRRSRAARRRPDLVGRVRGSGLGSDAAARPRARRDGRAGPARHGLRPRRLLADRRRAALGLRAPELGPAGYLPTDAAALRAALDAHGLRLVGGFMPVVLHEPSFAAAP